MKEVLLALVLMSPGAMADRGTMFLEWSEVPSRALFIVGYGGSPGSYDTLQMVGQTRVELAGLPDCQNTYVAVKARTPEGWESKQWSEEVFGWPDPVLEAVECSRQGASSREVQGPGTYDCVIHGVNFKPQAAWDATLVGVPAGEPVPVLRDITAPDCRTMEFSLEIGAFSAEVPLTLRVFNPDGSRGELADAIRYLPIPEVPRVEGLHRVNE